MEIFISLLVLFASISLFKFSIGSFSINELSMIGYLFYFKIILVTYIGVIAVLFHVDEKLDTYFFAITYEVSDESRRLGWYTTMYAIISLPLGMIFSNIIFLGKFNASTFIKKYQKKTLSYTFSIDRKEKNLFSGLFVFSIIATCAVLYVFYIIKTFPLYSMLTGEDDLILRQLRGAAKIEFEGITAIRDMIALPLTPFLSYVAYIAYKNTKFLKFKFLFYYLVFLSILILTYNTEKAPILFYGLSFLFLQSFIGEKTSLFKILLSSIIVLILLILMYFSVSGLDNLPDIINLLLARIFVGQTSAIFLAYEYFPHYHDFLGWSGVANIFANLSGETALSSGRVLFEIYSPASIENGTAGSLVGLFSAESWILFGISGVLFAPLWVGFFIQTLHIWMMKLPKNAIFISLYLYIMMHISLTGGLVTFLYPIVLIIFLVQVFSLYFVAYSFSDK